MQVVAAVVANMIGADDVYAVRHVVCALVGALGIIMIGLMGVSGEGCVDSFPCCYSFFRLVSSGIV